jgi:hypothetical protein
MIWVRGEADYKRGWWQGMEGNERKWKRMEALQDR